MINHQNKIDYRFKLLNREASLVYGLLSNGLYHLKRINYGDHEYYGAFYNLSTGLERMLKLLLYLKGKKFQKNHDIKELIKDSGIIIGCDIEKKIVDFLSSFAKGDRYTIIDDLMGNKKSEKEPIKKFYEDIIAIIFDIHKPRKIFILPSDLPFNTFLINEDFSETNDYQESYIRNQLLQHSSKYIAMYLGRILKKIILEINSFEGCKYNNPYFSEVFRYLNQNDKYFKTKKIFTSQK